MASGAKTRTQQTHLECEICENIVPIHRKRGKMKERNHIKHMYCFRCKETTAHIEVKEAAFFPAWLKEKIKEEEQIDVEQ